MIYNNVNLIWLLKINLLLNQKDKLAKINYSNKFNKFINKNNIEINILIMWLQEIYKILIIRMNN
jgi:hypothetical protein